MKLRSEIWKELKRKSTCQVLILGGGINGAGVFRELTHQGIDCVLVDKHDFVAGASSGSSRMIHGGLRYLENAEFKLVGEAVLERNRLLKLAPHFVFPLKTSIPIVSWFGGLIKSPLVFLGFPVTPGGRGAVVVKLGLMFYDFLIRKKRQTPSHFFMSRKKSLQQIPGLKTNIVCTANYWDAWVSQAERLCVDMIKESCALNEEAVALNYVNVERENDAALKLTDQVTGQSVLIQPRLVVNATGGWIDFTNERLGVETHFMGGTKGSHLVIDNKDLYEALGDRMVYYEHSDGRVCITFRFLDKVIMGSTDIKVDDPEQAECDEDEVDYMMTTLGGVFPNLKLSRDDIVFRYCGVRPLPASPMDYTSRVTRSHYIEVCPPDEKRSFAIYNLIGGKWTTFGVFAKQVTDKILGELESERIRTLDADYFPGAENFPKEETEKRQWIATTARTHNLDERYAEALLGRYGMESERIIGAKGEAMTQPLRTLPDYTLGEIQYITENECIAHLVDLVRRRSVIALLGLATDQTLGELASIVGELLGWDESRKEQEIAMALENASNGK